MMKNLCFIVFLCLLTACTTRAPLPEKIVTSRNPNLATKQIVNTYAPVRQPDLTKAFTRNGISYPPRKIALLTFKEEGKMELWAQGDTQPVWTYIKTYPVMAHSGSAGPKLEENDMQVPEGIYRITMLNPHSQWHLSMMLNYPNELDRQFARQEHRSRLGNNIFIHGKSSSAGCLAIGDDAITELFILVYQVGAGNTRVIIAPNDLRSKPAVTVLEDQPKWVPKLYAKLTEQLQEFQST
ncbi:MAG: L,D-transpeptidase family protein [Proteobacteria bacterium]|nr:L,D-transpeptidase family protein [Pseudomonadota bacterium]